MRLVLLLLVFAVASHTKQLPEFDDDFFGKLTVSNKKFPFLTPQHSPEIAHVYPTDQQLDKIKAAIGEPTFALRMRRAADEKEGANGSSSNSASPFAWFDDWKKLFGEFLKFEFTYQVLNSTIVDPGSLPFDKINSDASFKAMIVEPDQLKPYLENEFNSRMRGLAANEKPWLPAEKLIQEMKECLYFKFGSASDEDFKFDKETGGTMVYYKLSCMKIKDSYFIAFSIYDNKFTLHDIEHVDTIHKGWSFLGFSKQKTDIKRWFEKRYVALNDLKQLLDFIMRDFAERIRLEYGQYLATANIHN